MNLKIRLLVELVNQETIPQDTVLNIQDGYLQQTSHIGSSSLLTSTGRFLITKHSGLKKNIA